MRSFWMNLINLCEKKFSFYHSISQITYFEELKSKILPNKKSISSKTSNHIDDSSQFGEEFNSSQCDRSSDFILNEYIAINQKILFK